MIREERSRGEGGVASQSRRRRDNSCPLVSTAGSRIRRTHPQRPTFMTALVLGPARAFCSGTCTASMASRHHPQSRSQHNVRTVVRAICCTLRSSAGCRASGDRGVGGTASECGRACSAAEGEGEGRDVSSTDHDARSLPLLSKPSLVEDGSCGNPDHKSPELACRVCKHMVMDRKREKIRVVDC